MSDDAEQATPQRTRFREPEATVIYPEAFQKAPPVPTQPSPRRKTAAKRTATKRAKPKIDYSISRTPELELQFRAAIAEAQRLGVPNIGGCLNMWDIKSENGGNFFLREGTLRIGERDFEVGLYSLSNPPNPDERDESFGHMRIQQGIGRFTDKNGHRFEVYCPLRQGVAQMGDWRTWTVLNRTQNNKVIKRTLLEFLTNPEIDPAQATVAVPEIAGGFSFGSLNMRRDKRNLVVVSPAPVTAEPATTPAKKRKVASKVARKSVRKTARKTAKKTSKPKAKKKTVKVNQPKPKRRNPPRNGARPKRKPR